MAREPHRRLAAIMFTDMVGYSALAQRDEAASLAMLDRHNRTLRPLFAKSGGREIKTAGDSFLVEFGSALDATSCALEVQRTLHELNTRRPEAERILVRIGIHVGDVVASGSDVLGDAVNIAARIQPLASPGGICLSQQVYDQVQNKLPVRMAPLPPVSLKNIRTPIRVYRVVPPWETPASTEAEPWPPEGRQLAVLPLSNISPDPNDGYFADGLTEELIASLSQVRGLNVTARTSVLPYKAEPKPISQVGAELGVDTVLEGSVRKAGRQLRITLQLIDVSTQRHIWTSTYNRELDDVFAIQTDIAERTAEALRIELSRAERTAVSAWPTESMGAYDLYLRGLAADTLPAFAGLDEAVRSYEGATRLDPKFADAYAAWANLYVRASGDYLPMREVMPRARELAQKAVELDPGSSDAHAALGNIALQFDNDWARAEAEFVRAIEINPSNVNALTYYGLELVALERYDEARSVMRRTARLDPARSHLSGLSWLDIDSGHFESGLRMAEEDRDKNPNEAGPRIYLGLYYLTAGRLEDARREADTPLEPANGIERFDLVLLRALVGRPAEAKALLRDIEAGREKFYYSATDRAMLHSALGHRTEALDLLEQDQRGGDRVLWITYRGVFWDPIRSDPRFTAIIRDYGLPLHPIRGISPG